VEENVIKEEDVDFFLTNANSLIDTKNQFRNKKTEIYRRR